MVRVHELARELGVTSQGVLECLFRHGEYVRSASSTLQPSQARLVHTHIAEYVRTAGDCQKSGRTVLGLKPRQTGATAVPAERGDCTTPASPVRPGPRPGRAEPPEQVTAVEAQRLTGVKAATIRQWVTRGYLDRIGQRGRSALYDRKTVLAVREDVRRRTPWPPLHPTLDLPAEYDKRLITAAEAAVLIGVEPSTVRSWVSRGHLTPTSRAPRPHLFTVGAVLDASRRLRRGRY